MMFKRTRQKITPVDNYWITVVSEDYNKHSSPSPFLNFYSNTGLCFEICMCFLYSLGSDELTTDRVLQQCFKTLLKPWEDPVKSLLEAKEWVLHDSYPSFNKVSGLNITPRFSEFCNFKEKDTCQVARKRNELFFHWLNLPYRNDSKIS